MRCTRSATLVAPKYAAKARTSASASSSGTSARRCGQRIHRFALFAPGDRDAAHRLHLLQERVETCSASMSPTIAPSLRTSSRSRVSDSAKSRGSRNGRAIGVIVAG
jgi:hypothetical protein